MDFPSYVPGASKDEAYYHIVETARAWSRVRRGDRGFRNRELRWLLSEPEWELHGPRSRNEADQALAQEMRVSDGGEELDVEGLRRYLESADIAPMPPEHDCSERAFASYLDKLVDNRIFYKVERGRYRMHPFGQVRKVLETENVNDELLGERHQAIGLNLREPLDRTEEKLLDRVGDVMDGLAALVAIVQAGPEPEQLPDDLTEELVLRWGPLPYEAREDVEFALAVAGSPDVESAKEFGGDAEAYKQRLQRLRTSLDQLLEELDGRLGE